MVNIQDWVNKKYPNHWDKSQVKELHLNEPNLAGELDLSEFTKLRYEEGAIYLASFLDNKITFKNKSENTQIIKYLNVQNAFEREFPLYDTCLGEHDFSGWFWNAENQNQVWLYLINRGKSRREITHIKLDNKKLDGSLVISNFPNLEKVEIGHNYLTLLRFVNCPKLKEIDCSNNKLTDLNFYSLPTSLTHLNISNNNFSEQGLSVFSHLINLEELKIGNLLEQKFLKDKDNYNRFTGLLEPLRNLTKLKKMDIANTKISGSLEPLRNIKLGELDIKNTELKTGLEYLPENIGKLCCHVSQFSELEKHNRGGYTWESNYGYYYQTWRKDNPELIARVKIESQIDLLQKQFQGLLTKSERQATQNQQLQTQLENQNKKTNALQTKVDILQTHLDSLQTEFDKFSLKVGQAQSLLGIDNLDDLVPSLQGFDGEIWNLARWKQEIELEQEHAVQMDNFYRQNPPSENNALENILKEFTEDYLVLNLENKEKEEVISKLKENSKVIEKLISQTEDVFLPAKIEEKKEQLENLKKELLNTNQVSSEQLNEICRIQNELSFLELKQSQEQQLTQIQIPPKENN